MREVSSRGGSTPGRMGGHVVVPVDLSHDSWRVLPFAKAVGRQLGMPVSPMFVDTSTLGSHAVLEGSLTLMASIDGEAVSIDVVPGADVAGTIHQLVSRHPGSVVVMSTHGLGGFAARAWGSVSAELLRSTDTAVIGVGPQFDARRGQEVRRVVACVDPLAPDAGFAQGALEWAESLNVPITVVAPTGERPSRAAQVSTQRALTTLVDELRSQFPAIDTEVLDGTDVAAAIVRYVDRVPGVLLSVPAGDAPGNGVLTRRVLMTVARDARVPMLLGWSRGPMPVVPAQRVDETRSADLAGTACHDAYDEPPASALKTFATAGTECHDDYAVEYASFQADAADTR